MFSDRDSNQSAYNFPTNIANPIKNIKRKSTQKGNKKISKQQTNDKGLYYNIQVIRKVATFLQNIKSSTVMTKKQLLPLQALYLQNEDTQRQSSQNLIGWQNPILLVFQLTLLIMIIGVLWMNSYEFVFGRLELNRDFNTIFLGFYLCYIAIYLNTEYKNQKLEIIDSRKIILNYYIHNQLPYDFVIICGLVLQLCCMDWAFYPSRIMAMLIVQLFMTLTTKFENKFAVSIQVESIISILKLLFKIIIFIHFLTLIFNAMSIIEKMNGIDSTWIQKNNFSHSSLFERYVYGWYWASTIISTVGFGDITPASTYNNMIDVYECGFISFIELLCSVMLGYSVNYIGTMIGVFGQSKATYEKDIRRLNKYLKTLTIPGQLQNSIRSHFFNKYQIEQVYDAQSEHYLFMKLTEKLRTDVKQTNNLNIIKKCKNLSVLSEQTLQKLAGVMKKAVYAPSQILFDETSQNIKLFIIQEGKVNELPLINKYHNKQKPIITYNNQEQNTIGWINLLSSNRYVSCAEAQTYTITYQILRDQFIAILKKNSKDYFKFHQIRQKIIQKPMKYIKSCLVCGRLTHSVVECNKIHFIPKKIQSLLIHGSKQLSKTNKRKSGYKRGQNKINMVNNKNTDEIESIYDQESNKQSNTRDSNRIKQQQSSIVRAIFNNRQKNNQYDGKDYRISLQNKVMNYQSSLKAISINLDRQYLKSNNNIKKSSESIRKLEEYNKYPILEENMASVGYNQNSLLDGINEDIKMKILALNRLDKVMMQQNKQFYPEYNINQVTKIIKLDILENKLASKFQYTLADLVQDILS